MITLQIVLGELESDLLPGQLLIDGREGVGLMFNVGLLSFIKMNLNINNEFIQKNSLL